MDYSFLDDPTAIAGILATATSEHRALQHAEGWDDKTLAIEIATCRNLGSHIPYAHEQKEWEDRVMRMSDEDLEIEDDIIRAKLEPHVKEHQALSREDQEKTSYRFITIMRRAKARLSFTKREREFRAEKKRYSEGLTRMSDEVFLKEVRAVTYEMSRHCEELAALPFNAEPRDREKLERQSRATEAKHELIMKERNRRGQT